MLRICVSLLLLSVLTSAIPTVKERSVSSSDLNNFSLFGQYSCAAYNPKNFEQNGSPQEGTAITCQPGKCPLVQAATTSIIIEFAIPGAITSDPDATGFVVSDETNHLVIVSFRGSADISNWITNAQILFYDPGICDNCQVHLGFWNAWQSVRDKVWSALIARNLTYKIILTGHSLGGAIATLAAADLRDMGYDIALYTYGAPMVGNRELALYISDQPGGNYRVTHLDDPVPRLPSGVFDYSHITPEYWITTGNNVPVTKDDILDLPRGGGDEGEVTDDINAHLWYFNNITSC